MSFVDGIIEWVIEMVVPGYVCPLLRDCAGQDCMPLKQAILMNDSLVTAYAQNAESVGLVNYDTVKRLASRYPAAKKFVTTERVLGWLKDEGHEDIIAAINETPGGMLWLNRQVEGFKKDLFGDA